MAAQHYIEKVNGFIVPFLGKNGFTLIKTEFVSEDNIWYLRLYIDLTAEELEKRKMALEAKKEAAGELQESESDAHEDAADEEEELVPGVSINDCVKVSRYLSKWLDKEDFIKEVYTMEVCSKGFLDSANTVEVEEGESE